MSRKLIDAILWRSYLGATSDAVWEANNSQYYFELPTGDYEGFFDGNCQAFVDKDNNDAFRMTLEAFDGVPPVGPHEVIFTKKRSTASRKDNWTVDSIRDGTNLVAYDLWRKNRGPIDQYKLLSPAEKNKNYIVIVRDSERKFHGRWIRGSDFDALPQRIQTILSSKGFGWSEL